MKCAENRASDLRIPFTCKSIVSQIGLRDHFKFDWPPSEYKYQVIGYSLWLFFTQLTNQTTTYKSQTSSERRSAISIRGSFRSPPQLAVHCFFGIYILYKIGSCRWHIRDISHIALCNWHESSQICKGTTATWRRGCRYQSVARRRRTRWVHWNPNCSASVASLWLSLCLWWQQPQQFHVVWILRTPEYERPIPLHGDDDVHFLLCWWRFLSFTFYIIKTLSLDRRRVAYCANKHSLLLPLWWSRSNCNTGNSNT